MHRSREIAVGLTIAVFAATTAILAAASPEAGATCESPTAQIWTSDADGNNRAKISDVDAATDPINNVRGQWSPDGTRIAWDGLVAGLEIYVANADGTSRFKISDVTAGTDPTNNRRTQWSPNDNGARVTWTGNDGTTDHIYVALADGSGRTKISDVSADPDPTLNMDSQWSPDGSRLAWSENTALTGTIDPNGTTTVTGVGTLFTTELVVGDKLIVNGETQTIATIATDTSLTVGAAFTDTANDTSPDRARSGIFVAMADGTGRVDISTVGGGADPTGNLNPQWSHDNTKIAWAAADGIYVANADGTARVNISVVDTDPDPTDNATPQWSHDSTKITWAAADGIYVANADGTSRVKISDVGGGSVPIGNAAPQWSSDSMKIAWDGHDGVTSQIFVANPEGTARTKISDVDTEIDPVSNRNPQWSSGGRLLWEGVEGSCLPPPGDCPTAPSPFTDISTSFAKADIDCVFELGVAAGLTTTTYGPLFDVSRQEMAAFLARLWRVLGGTCSTAPTPFTDISTSFAQADIACIFALTITSGNTATTYGPLLNVTREEMAAFLARFWRALGNTCSTAPTPFTDISTSFAAADIACIYALGIAAGISSTAYGPGAKVTRQEMAAFLARLWRAATAP